MAQEGFVSLWFGWATHHFNSRFLLGSRLLLLFVFSSITLCFFGFLNIFCALRFDQSGFFSILLRLSLLVGGLSD